MQMRSPPLPKMRLIKVFARVQKELNAYRPKSQVSILLEKKHRLSG